MKKLILVLALVLVASPAFALNLTLTQQGTTSVYDLGYAGADPGNLPRAFALDVVVTGGATISAVTPTMTGESTSGTPGYGIFPGTIAIDGNGVVTSYGSPVAPDTDPGASGTGIGTDEVILELGSLYVGGPNAPGTSGLLCTLTLNCGGASAGKITVSEEDTYRGGVVLEDGTSATVAAKDANSCVLDCLNQAVVPVAEWDAWVAWGKPNCWCYKRQCRGDTDGVIAGPYWVSIGDLNLLRSAYNKFDATLATITNGICADLDHIKSGPYRVAISDLNALRSYYNKFVGSVPCCDANQDCILTPPEKWNFWTN
jgi:hypothetical protein